ncbi:TPA: murein biosynthesis integral membrane protein MurJ [Bacillus toyonensis]|nr:murein biosynthesis integral membrane protein MurJ [Bacillus toyonensis]
MGNSKNLKAYVLFTFSAIISILLGFCRESLIAYKFGTGSEIDALIIALIIPLNIFASIFESISITLIPILNSIKKNIIQKKAVNVFLNYILFILSGFNIVICILVVINSVSISSLLTTNSDMDIKMLKDLISICTVIIVFSGISAVLIAALNMQQQYKYTARMQVIYNITLVVCLLFLPDLLGIKGAAIAYVIGELAKTSFLMFGAIKSKVLQISQVLLLKDMNFHFKKFFIMLVPLLIGVGFTEIKNILDRFLASELSVGSVAILNYALKLYILPIGILITGITTVSYVDLSKVAMEKDETLFLNVVQKTLRIASLIILPASALMYFYSDFLVQLAYQRGAFTVKDTMMVSSVFKCFAIGTLFYVWRHLLNRIFWSMENARVPLKANIVFFLSGSVILIAIYKLYRVEGIALSTSISLFITSVYLLIQLKKIYVKYNPLSIYIYILKVTIAVGAMLICMYIVHYEFLVNIISRSESLMLQLVGVIFNSILGLVVFMLFGKIMKISEVTSMFNYLRKKLKY